MSLSAPAATDYLVTLAQQATTGVTANGLPFAVEDGWPDQLTWGMFVIGVSVPPPDIQGETSGTRMWAEMGALALEEDYTIPCYISVTIGDATQKTVRDMVAEVYNNFWALLKADLTLGGILTAHFAEVINLRFIPSRVGTTAEPGRQQVLTFDVHCANLIGS